MFCSKDLEALTYTFSTQYDQTWTQFILNNTIPILLNRLNHRTPSDFINRIISIKNSTNSSPLNSLENKSSPNMINNILQKLQINE